MSNETLATLRPDLLAAVHWLYPQLKDQQITIETYASRGTTVVRVRTGDVGAEQPVCGCDFDDEIHATILAVAAARGHGDCEPAGL